MHIDISILQSIGDDQGTSMLVRSLLFYVVINLEAFIFCFAGEYLSMKVSKLTAVLADDNACFFMSRIFAPIWLPEQDDRRRGVWVSVVRFDSQRESNPAIPDNEITKAIDDHRRQIHESLFATIRECKFYVIIDRIICYSVTLHTLLYLLRSNN